MGLMLRNNKLLVAGGKIAADPKCCCGVAECCDGTLPKTLYLDIFSGLSGDMFVGALIDLGVDAHKLERELAKLKLDGYHLQVARQHRSGINGVKFEVHFATPFTIFSSSIEPFVLSWVT